MGKRLGKISKIVDDEILSDPLLAVIITNSVYFNASWVHKFEAIDTVKSEFWVDTKNSVDVHYDGANYWSSTLC